MQVLLSLLFPVCLHVLAFANEPVTVQTKYGDVLGYQTDQARFFYAIPFAQPPIDKLN